MGEKETMLVKCLSSYPNLSLHCPRENKWWLIAAKSALRDPDKAHTPETSPPEGKERNEGVHTWKGSQESLAGLIGEGLSLLKPVYKDGKR